MSGGVLWANLHLLFWLSLVPFLTGWMSENDFPPVPTAAYGIVLLAAALAYYMLQATLLRACGPDSLLAAAVGRDAKGKLSPLLYCLGIGLSFANRWLGVAVYVLVALIWLVPDRRVERVVTTRPDEAAGLSQGRQLSCGCPGPAASTAASGVRAGSRAISASAAHRGHGLGDRAQPLAGRLPVRVVQLRDRPEGTELDVAGDQHRHQRRPRPPGTRTPRCTGAGAAARPPPR